MALALTLASVPAMVARCINLHTIHIDNRAVVFHPTTYTNPINVNGTSDPSILKQIDGKLDQLVQTAIIVNLVVTPKQAKGKFENHLNAEFQTLILTVSTEHSGETITDPCATKWSLFEQKNAEAAKAYFHCKLEIEENLPIHLPTSLSTACHSGVLFLENMGCPSNLFFLVPHKHITYCQTR